MSLILVTVGAFCMIMLVLTKVYSELQKSTEQIFHHTWHWSKFDKESIMPFNIPMMMLRAMKDVKLACAELGGIVV